MDRHSASRIAVMQGSYVVACLGLMALRLMPHHLRPGGWPAPDLVISLTFAWVLRRPEHVPLLLVVAIGLLSDLLYQRPPGPMAALIVLASDVLRGRGLTPRPLMPMMEWGLVAILCLGMTLAHWAILGVTLVPQPALRYELWQAAMTILSYPLVVAALRASGIRKPDLAKA